MKLEARLKLQKNCCSIIKWSIKRLLNELLRALDVLTGYVGIRFFRIKTTTEIKLDQIDEVLSKIELSEC